MLLSISVISHHLSHHCHHYRHCDTKIRTRNIGIKSV